MSDFDKLVQNLVNASHEEGRQEAFGTEPMQPYYDRTHAAVNALLNAIARVSRLPPMGGGKGGKQE